MKKLLPIVIIFATVLMINLAPVKHHVAADDTLIFAKDGELYFPNTSFRLKPVSISNPYFLNIDGSSLDINSGTDTSFSFIAHGKNTYRIKVESNGKTYYLKLSSGLLKKTSVELVKKESSGSKWTVVFNSDDLSISLKCGKFFIQNVDYSFAPQDACIRIKTVENGQPAGLDTHLYLFTSSDNPKYCSIIWLNHDGTEHTMDVGDFLLSYARAHAAEAVNLHGGIKAINFQTIYDGLQMFNFDISPNDVDTLNHAYNALKEIGFTEKPFDASAVKPGDIIVCKCKECNGNVYDILVAKEIRSNVVYDQHGVKIKRTPCSFGHYKEPSTILTYEEAAVGVNEETTAVKVDTGRVFDIIFDSTVAIYYEQEDEDGQIYYCMGTGTVVYNDLFALVMTANHVLPQRASKYYIVTDAGTWLEGRTVYTDSLHDQALIETAYIDGKRAIRFEADTLASRGEELFIIGYAGGFIDEDGCPSDASAIKTKISDPEVYYEDIPFALTEDTELEYPDGISGSGVFRVNGSATPVMIGIIQISAGNNYDQLGFRNVTPELIEVANRIVREASLAKVS